MICLAQNGGSVGVAGGVDDAKVNGLVDDEVVEMYVTATAKKERKSFCPTCLRHVDL